MRHMIWFACRCRAGCSVILGGSIDLCGDWGAGCGLHVVLCQGDTCAGRGTWSVRTSGRRRQGGTGELHNASAGSCRTEPLGKSLCKSARLLNTTHCYRVVRKTTRVWSDSDFYKAEALAGLTLTAVSPSRLKATLTSSMNKLLVSSYAWRQSYHQSQ